MEVKEISNARYKPASQADRDGVKEKIKKMQKDGDKLVKGMFEFIDAQGGWLDFSYRFFPGEPCRTVRIIHGEIVDLPMVLVKHLNNVWKKVRIPSPVRDENGRALKKEEITKFSRTRFTPMDVL